jgi:hypothetical protein
MSGAARILGSFDIKPTAAAAGAKPDELMIDFTTLPAGAVAAIYLPAVSADDIRAAAAAIHGYQPFSGIDAHTVGCEARGVVYLPIPRAPGNLAGFIDVTLPETRPGGRFTVAVTQLTNAGIGERDTAAARRNRATWRTGAGSFQLALLAKRPAETRALVAGDLAVMRWLFQSVPPDSRWRPVFVRYLGALENQLIALGGDPAAVPPSPGGASFPSPGGSGLSSGTSAGSLGLSSGWVWLLIVLIVLICLIVIAAIAWPGPLHHLLHIVATWLGL